MECFFFVPRWLLSRHLSRNARWRCQISMPSVSRSSGTAWNSEPFCHCDRSCASRSPKDCTGGLPGHDGRQGNRTGVHKSRRQAGGGNNLDWWSGKRSNRWNWKYRGGAIRRKKIHGEVDTEINAEKGSPQHYVYVSGTKYSGKDAQIS